MNFGIIDNKATNKLTSLTFIVGTLSTLSYLVLANLSEGYGDISLEPFLLLSMLNALLCFVLWYLHQRCDQQISVIFMLAFAVLFRVIGTFTFPIMEDDFYRYLWDAHQTWQLGTPYGPSPGTYFDDSLSAPLSERFEVILGSINYPDVATIYGPVAQWVFALAYLIAPGEVWPLQWLLASIDIGLIFLLLIVAKPNAVLLYAWCPLIIKEFSITAHPDIIGAFLIVAALILHRRNSVAWAACLLALAVGVKLFAILILPFFLQFNWRAWFAFLATAILIAFPFGIIDAWFPSGLSAMSQDWLFNAPLYLILNQWLNIAQIKLILLSILALFCIWQFLYYYKRKAHTTLIDGLKGEWLYGLLFLCAPVFNPWYLVWLLPFAVIRPSLWAWTISVTALFAYASGINLPNLELQSYAHPGWAIALEFIPVLLAIAAAYFIKKREQN
jgi:hypothetical protein